MGARRLANEKLLVESGSSRRRARLETNRRRFFINHLICVKQKRKCYENFKVLEAFYNFANYDSNSFAFGNLLRRRRTWELFFGENSVSLHNAFDFSI